MVESKIEGEDLEEGNDLIEVVSNCKRKSGGENKSKIDKAFSKVEGFSLLGN